MRADQNVLVPHKREAQASSSSNNQEKLKYFSIDFEKKMKIKDQGMGEYSFESLCLSKLSTSPKSHGQPSTSRHKVAQPINKFDGKFIQVGTVTEESEDKDILNWLYKDEEETRATSLEVTIPTQKHGNGFRIMQWMGYKGKGPISKPQLCITEPIQHHSQLTKDKSRLGYGQHIQPIQK